MIAVQYNPTSMTDVCTVYGVSFGVGQEGFEPDINTQLFAGWNVFNFALSLDAELAVVSICPPDNANPLDDTPWKGLDLLFLVSNQTEAANPTAISEGDMFAIIIKLPSGSLVTGAFWAEFCKEVHGVIHPAVFASALETMS